MLGPWIKNVLVHGPMFDLIFPLYPLFFVFNQIFHGIFSEMEDLLEGIKKQNDPEILKEALAIIIKEHHQLKKSYRKVLDEIETKKQLNFQYIDVLTIMRKLIFGRGGEKIKGAVSFRKRSTADEELLVHAKSLVPPPKPEEIGHLVENIRYHSMNKDALIREGEEFHGLKKTQGKNWQEIKGLFEKSTEITVIERIYKKVKHMRKKYLYKPSKGTGSEIIITAPGPEKILPGSSYSIDFGVAIVADKFLYHLPLERQRRQMENNGLPGVDVKTLYNLTQAVSVHLEPIAAKIKKDIFAAGLAVGCDETPWPILNKKDSNGYMWVMSNQAGSYFQFEPTRSGKVIREMLKSYRGPIISDAYSGYNRLKKVPGMNVALCWAHARRKFIEIQDNYPVESREILLLMKDLFNIEHEAKDFDELKLLRATKSKTVIDKIRTWMFENKNKHLPESGFTKAIMYTMKRWGGFTAFLNDERIPLTNNDTERAIRPSVVGRKNFYGSKSINGADVASVIYTVIESCKKVELNPTSYIKYVIKEHWHKNEALSPLKYAKKIRDA